MPIALQAGLVLGGLVAVWTFVMGFTGWYKDPALLWLFFLVIPIQIGVLWWALKRGVALGQRYGTQVRMGTLASFVAGVVIAASSLLFTTVAFPRYFDDLRALHEENLRQAGRTPEQIEREVAEAAAQNTPAANALAGFVGTVVTGVFVSLVLAVPLRKR
jgi:hypothetical protein